MSFSVHDILEFTGGRLVNQKDIQPKLDQIQVNRLSTLTDSQPQELAFFFNRAFENELQTARPGILIIGEPFVQLLRAAQLPFWNDCAVIACPDPYYSMAVLSEKFAEKLSSVSHLIQDQALSVESNRVAIHPSAVVSPSANLGFDVEIGPFCVIEAGSTIGAHSILYPGCFIGPHCKIGESTVLFPNVTLYERTEVGNRVRIHAQSVIGADGFGYAPKFSGKKIVGHQKIFHLGKVVIEDDVEIGANSCVDRATFGETRIKKHSKLDNLVQIGHNVFLDEGAIICGGTCLAGNSSVGKYTYVAGVCGIANHVHIGDGAKVGAMTLVSKDVPPGATVVGSPQREYREHFQVHALLNKLLRERRSK